MVLDVDDNCQFDPNGDQYDYDGDQQGDVCDQDDDNDGVADDVDQCVETALSVTTDTSGCSIAQQCPSDNPATPWKNHGQYVSCVSNVADEFFNAGLITKTEKDATVSAAAQSSVGKKNDAGGNAKKNR